MSKAKAKKRAAAPKKATALAVRKKAPAPLIRIQDPTGALTQHVGQLGELATVGALGLAELRLTPEEDQILGEPVNPADVLLKPKVKGGPPEIAYLPHIVYTRWFHRAFGRTGWACVPTAAPKKVNNLILVPYLLYVHGVPVAAATGEQEYHETNLQQTYGDVIESTVASALRRFAKRLGVGLELWDKRWLEANFGKRAVRGRRDEVVEAEVERGESFRSFVGAEPVSSQPESTKITNAQRKRLTDIAERAGRDASEVRLWLKKRFGAADGSKDVRQSDYAEVCRCLEARGALTFPGDGQ